MSYGEYLGQGQKVIKHENASSESSLKVKQKRIMSGASLKAYTWIVFSVLMIGPDLGVAVGYGVLVAGAFYLLRSPFVQEAYERRLRGCLLAAVSVGLGVLWYLHGWYIVKSVWPPLFFLRGWLYVAERRIVPGPVWARVLLIGGAAAAVASELALTVEMWIEMFDSNWPPTYQAWDGNDGPWNPLKKRLPPTDEEELLEPELPSGGERPVDVDLWVPVTEHTDIDALEVYRRRDLEERAVESEDYGNGYH